MVITISDLTYTHGLRFGINKKKAEMSFFRFEYHLQKFFGKFDLALLDICGAKFCIARVETKARDVKAFFFSHYIQNGVTS